MNTEKLEKLKKSLDNKFIPDNMKDKIRVEIQKLESEIKTDDTITATEVKEEVKEIEKKVEKALEVADKKEEQAKAKAPARTRAKRTPKTETKKPKPNKKSVFSVAKEIRKAGESWEDAKKRASKMMKSETTETKKKVRTETSKLLASIRRKKELKNLTGTNIKRDINRTALPKGKRISKNGKVYYEYRDDHSDRLAPSYKDKIYLADGGGVGKKPTLKKGDVVEVVGRRWFDRVNGNTYHTAEVFVNDKFVAKSRMTYGYDEQYVQTAKELLLENYNLPKGMKETSPLWQLREYGVTLTKSVSDGLKRDLAEGGTIIGTPETPLGRDLGISYTGLVGETGAMSSGEMFAKGGKTNERRHVNKAEDYEVRYAKSRPARKGYLDKRDFATGGGVGNAPKEVEERLEYLRGEIRNESISYDEIAELQSMKEYIAPDDVELLEWAGVEEYREDEYARGGSVSPFKNMMETNTITEKEINLIKLRMNNDKVDDFTQEAIDFIWDNSPQLTPDQNKKGIDYLRNLWKSPSGKERVNNPFGYREQDALETFEYFELRGFYDAGNRYRKFYVPLYICVGAETSFEYYISGGEINIVG
jgi:hypothetical protein